MYEYALTPSMSISFQRYPYPPDGFVTALPTSWGALPLLLGVPGRLVVPCPEGEAFWIGLVPSAHGGQTQLRVIALLASEQRVDAMTGALADDIQPTDVKDLPAAPNSIPGIFRGDGGWWAFARDNGDTTAPVSLAIELFCRSVVAAEPVRETDDPGRQHAGPGHQDDPPHQPPAPEQRPSSPPDPEIGSSVRVDVVGPEDFQVLGGMPVQPLEEANHYGGWRLP